MGKQMGASEMEKTYRFEERIKKEFFVFQMCNHVVATTNPQFELLTAHYDVLPRRITVIPPGMDENRYSPVRMEDKKMLQEKYGFGPQDIKGVDELKKMAKELNIEDKIVWRPYIPDEELADYYRAAAIFALASRYEPFGMVAIEAMACGTPAVVTVHGGLNFGNQALFADPNRPEKFGAMLAMPMLYENLALEISVEGARFARRMFGWTGIAKRMLNIFDSFINVNAGQSDSSLYRNNREQVLLT